MLSNFDLANGLVEFAAVVLGILLALWVNNWNEERKERRRETDYLRSLRDDIDADRAALAAYAEFAEGTAEAATSLIRLIRDRGAVPPEHATLVRLLKRAGMLYPFRPTSTTYKELSGGGGLSLITDRGLLRSIIAYYAAADLPEELGALAVRRIWYDYYDALSTSIDPVLIPQMSRDVFDLMREGSSTRLAPPGPDRALPDLAVPIDPGSTDALAGNEELARALAMVLDSATVVRESMTDLRARAESLSAAIGAVLEVR